MVVHYTLQGSGGTNENKKEPSSNCAHTKQINKFDNEIANGWWAAQVAKNKEYDTKREIINTCKLQDEDILIPRRMIYSVKENKVDKKTEIVLPGYLLLKLGNKKIMQGLAFMQNYISILGKVSSSEIDRVKKYENIPEETNANIGDRIMITKGPFAGVKGTIIEKLDNTFCKCKLSFQGNEIITNINPKIVEKTI